jgi:hypothetical protein
MAMCLQVWLYRHAQKSAMQVLAAQLHKLS